jgi:hypothetical protein
VAVGVEVAVGVSVCVQIKGWQTLVGEGVGVYVA